MEWHARAAAIFLQGSPGLLSVRTLHVAGDALVNGPNHQEDGERDEEVEHDRVLLNEPLLELYHVSIEVLDDQREHDGHAKQP
jgi:hypothetical protein